VDWNPVITVTLMIDDGPDRDERGERHPRGRRRSQQQHTGGDAGQTDANHGGVCAPPTVLRRTVRLP
jgi:hypothetical protein